MIRSLDSVHGSFADKKHPGIYTAKITEFSAPQPVGQPESSDQVAGNRKQFLAIVALGSQLHRFFKDVHPCHSISFSWFAFEPHPLRENP